MIDRLTLRGISVFGGGHAVYFLEFSHKAVFAYIAAFLSNRFYIQAGGEQKPFRLQKSALYYIVVNAYAEKFFIQVLESRIAHSRMFYYLAHICHFLGMGIYLISQMLKKVMPVCHARRVSWSVRLYAAAELKEKYLHIVSVDIFAFFVKAVMFIGRLPQYLRQLLDIYYRNYFVKRYPELA